jgi:hypothetical protein
MIVQSRLLMERLIIITQIKTHVKEKVPSSQVHFHFRSGQAVDQPIQCIILFYSVVDEFCVFAWYSRGAECLACGVLLEHFDLKATNHEFKEQYGKKTLTSNGELNNRSPNKIEPRDSG